jgi:RES domain-containing protein
VAAAVERVSLRADWWRQVAAGLDPLELREPAGDGRWQRGEAVAALYLADTPKTVWAEWYRALAELALPPRFWLPCELWRIEVELDAVADLSQQASLAALGLAPPAPGRRSWPSYQRVGERLAAEGFEGVLAPSAARPAGRVLCVFRGREVPAGIRAAGSTRVEEPPAPPRGLRT